MRNKISRNAEAIRKFGCRGPVKIILALALGFIVSSQLAMLKAQEPAQQGVGATLPAGTPAAPPAAPSVPPAAMGYLISPGDVLDIYVFDVPEISRAYTVSPSGGVSVPLLADPVQAAGLTPDQLARSLEEAFQQSGRLRRPEISVSVSKPSMAETVAVEGAVRTPQILTEMTPNRLVDILTQCGGLSDDAGASVTITRGLLALRDLSLEGQVATPTLTLELKKVMDASDPASATEVWPGDRVSVQRERPDVYYVLGEVRSPGGYTLRRGHEELTVLRALALAGDATPVAKRSKAMIIRKDPKAPHGRDEIKLDLKSILDGRVADPKLQADDILFVPGSNAKKALRTLTGAPASVVDAAAYTAIIYH